MNMATLYQIGDDGSQAKEWEIGQEPLIVGRSRQAEVNIADDGLSRHHFLIVRDGEDYVIKDLNSRNGTWVEGHRVFAEKLRHNNLILAGHTRFRFAAPPAISATGPHGTVLLSALPKAEHDSSDAVHWQQGPADERRATR